MLFLFIGVLMLIALGALMLQFAARVRVMSAVAVTHQPVSSAARYRPMLRLLSDNDVAFAGFSRSVKRKVRAQRRLLFRGYLRCLTKDYGRLLMGIRAAMVSSGVDRPDLARIVTQNQMLFAIALCRIEFHLQLHALGLGKVDVSGLVEALDMLRTQVSVIAPNPLLAR